MSWKGRVKLVSLGGKRECCLELEGPRVLEGE